MGEAQHFSGILFSLVLKCKDGCRLPSFHRSSHGMHRPCEAPSKSTASELAPRLDPKEIGPMRSEALQREHELLSTRTPRRASLEYSFLGKSMTQSPSVDGTAISQMLPCKSTKNY